MKLRRRREEAWEVVTLQDKRRTPSVLASVKQVDVLKRVDDAF